MSLLPPIWHGTLREHYLVLFGAASAMALTAGLLGAWLGAYLGARRAAKQALRTPARTAEQELAAERMAQLARAVDAIAVEVERISENQRFASRLLVERGGMPASPPPRAPGVTTPH